MSNVDNILERILLNMGYDSKKTLSENRLFTKKIIKEACIPLDAQPNLSPDGNVINGELRYKQYPELGKWGDGKCKCVDKKRCLQFKEKCCKKINVSIDKLEELPNEEENSNVEFLSEKSWDGSLLTLPKNAKITYRSNCGNYKFAYDGEYTKIKNDFPRFLKACKTQYQIENDINTCLQSYFNSFIGKCSDNGIHAFELDGLTYTPCFSIGGEDGVYLPPEDLTLTGYYGRNKNTPKSTGNECPGVKWEGYESYKKSQVRQKEDWSSNNDNQMQFDSGQGVSSGQYNLYLTGDGE